MTEDENEELADLSANMCPCWHDGGTGCGAVNCGLLTDRPQWS